MIHFPPIKLVTDITKKLYWQTKSKFFWKPILASHRHWSQRTKIGKKWELIGEDIECSQSLARWPEGPEQSRIALRTKNGRKFDSVTLVVEADPYGSKYIQEETRNITDVGEHSRIIMLSGFPTYKLTLTSDNYFYSYEEYRIRITYIVENRVGRYVNLETPVYTLFDQTITNHRDWANWRGTPVNLSLIRGQQDILKQKIWSKLGHPQLGLGWRYRPELTNWASGTHKRTKLERISGSLSAEQALTAFQPARVAGAVMTGIISFPHILNRNQIDLENPALEPVAQSRAAMKIFSI